jgi:dipeptidyl aminopeptidase/acylaminoacyl peptidase
MMRRYATAKSVVLLAFATAEAVALLWGAPVEAARPVTFDDIMAMRRVESPAISPDGAFVLFTVRQWESSSKEPQKKEARTQIWRVSTTSGAPARQLTWDEAGASRPAWSPDGRYISFLSTRGASADDRRAQLWVMRADGGEAWKLTDSKEAITAYAWSPDSRRIAYVSREPETSDEEARRKRGDDRRLFENEFRLSHVWVVNVPSNEATRLTEGKTLTVRGEPSWSPEGTRLVFAAAPTTMIRDERDDLYILDVASRQLQQITRAFGPERSPRWSPDGKTIAFAGTINANTPWPDGTALPAVAHSKLMLYDVASGTIKSASPIDVDFDSPSWTPDSRRLLFTSGKSVYREVFAYDVAAARYAQLTSERVVALGTTPVSRDGAKVTFIQQSSTLPQDVYVSDLSFASPRKLTDVNPQTRDFALGQTEVIRWKNDGFDVEGILLKPANYQAGRRYPLLVVVHGGPTGAFHNDFRVSYGDGGQHWAGQGWAVLYPNPRGSTNYGETFMRANIPDWGGGDFRDIMTGVDAVIARGVADPDRLAIQGWSYGGYMTAWAITQTTRFKAAMVGAGITNLWSMYGTNDIPNYLAAFFKGFPTPDTLALYMERSAVSHAHHVTTPTLILHGSSDERVPIGQPMELYRALKDRGKTVELVFYPRQGHGVSEYYHQLDRLTRQFDWITRHTLGERERKTTTSE